MPSAGVDRAVVGHRVAAVVRACARLEQRHEVQVGDAQLGEVVEPSRQLLQRAREPVGVGDVADHPLVLVPARIDLATPVDVAQIGGARRRGRQRDPDEALDQPVALLAVERG